VLEPAVDQDVLNCLWLKGRGIPAIWSHVLVHSSNIMATSRDPPGGSSFDIPRCLDEFEPSMTIVYTEVSRGIPQYLLVKIIALAEPSLYPTVSTA